MIYAMPTQFQWTSANGCGSDRSLSENNLQLALCTEFAAEVDRPSTIIGVSSRAQRMRMPMRVVRQKVRADGTLETDNDVLDWLKFAQSETTGIKLGFSRVRILPLF